MKANVAAASAPPPPPSPSLHVASESSLLVSLEPLPPPPDSPGPSTSALPAAAALVTAYRVEWSLEAGFGTLLGSAIIRDLRKAEVVVGGLPPGQPCFVRLAAGGIKGFGEPTPAQPPCAVPSSEHLCLLLSFGTSIVQGGFARILPTFSHKVPVPSHIPCPHWGLVCRLA